MVIMQTLLSLTGSFVNVILVTLGGGLGLLLKKGLPERVSDMVMKGLALCVIYIGISGSLDGTNTLVTVVSMALGAIIGSWIDIDKHVNNLAKKVEKKFDKGNGESTFAEGLVAATMLYCVGAMSIVGSLDSGISHDYSTLITKSVIDGVTAIVLASTMGWGVLFSSVPVFIYQGSITLLAGVVAPLLSDYMISEMTCTGSLLIVAIGLNMLGVTKIKVMNCLPAVILPILVCLIIK